MDEQPPIGKSFKERLQWCIRVMGKEYALQKCYVCGRVAGSCRHCLGLDDKYLKLHQGP